MSNHTGAPPRWFAEAMRIAQLAEPKAAWCNSNLVKGELETPPFFLHEQFQSSQQRAPAQEHVQSSAPAAVAASMKASEYQTEPFIKLRLPLFTPNQADIWVDMVEDSFLIHGIKDLKRRMLEIRMALTPELRSLTAHMTSQPTNNSYIKLMSYLRRYNSRNEIQKTRALIVKRPIGKSTPSMHLHALREEFGDGDGIQPLLRQMLQDSLPRNIAPLLDTEHIYDLDDYAERADQLYIMYPPHEMPEPTKGLPGSAAAAESAAKETESKKTEPEIAVITKTDKTTSTTASNEIKVALSALSSSIQELTTRLDKIETKPTVAVVTKTEQEQEKQQRSRNNHKPRNFNASPQQALMPINAYAYQPQQLQPAPVYNLIPPQQYNSQYIPNFQQQQPNNWRQQQQPYQPRQEFNNEHNYPQQQPVQHYQSNYKGKNFNSNYNSDSFNRYNESYKRRNPDEHTNYQQPRNNYQQQSERQQQNNYQQLRNQQRAIANHNDRWCNYHNQYQQNARNCRPPCCFFSDNGVVPPANLLIQPPLDQGNVNSCATTISPKKEKRKQ